MSRRLILLARAPAPGRAKTRLAPALGPEGASRLYEALLMDTVDGLRRVEAPLELHVAGQEDAAGWFRRRFPDLAVRPQEGSDLGERVTAAFRDSFRRGAARTVAVGSDHPTLPAEHVNRAFRLLERADAVLGPGRDGGYYAVGLRRETWPGAAAIFRDIPWSTGRVLEATRAAAADAGLELAELPLWYDVDRPDDLTLLRRDASPGSHSIRTLRALESEADRIDADGDPGRSPS